MRTIVILLKSLCPHTGNCSTAQRIQSYFHLPDYKCVMIGANSFSNANGEEFNGYLFKEEVDLVIGIHAYHAGQLLINSSIPYIIIFGGTDLNQFAEDAHKLDIMTKAVQGSTALVVFSRALEKKAEVMWTDLPMHKYHPIPQAVTVNPSSFKIVRFLLANHFLPQSFSTCFRHPRLICLVTGIRPVKDPLFLVQAFTKWHRHNQDTFLLIVGPIIDQEYARKFQAKIQGKPGLIFIPGMKHEDVHATIRDSYAVINSSVNEGMSTALLEAMSLETVVIVRDNPGNCSLVHHRENGLVFRSPSDFISCITEVLNDDALRQVMIHNAKQMVLTKHCHQSERRLYHDMVNNCTTKNISTNT